MAELPTIEDRRGATRSIPAVEALQKILLLVPRPYLVGIRKIVLLDDDYRRDGKGKVLGRYVPVRGTNRADIELFFVRYSDVPDEAMASPRWLLFTLASILAHELYHHLVRAHRKHRPQFRFEQENADRWGGQLANQIYHGLPGCEDHWAEWERIRQAFDQQRRRQESDPGSG